MQRTKSIDQLQGSEAEDDPGWEICNYTVHRDIDRSRRLEWTEGAVTSILYTAPELCI